MPGLSRRKARGKRENPFLLSATFRCAIWSLWSLEPLEPLQAIDYSASVAVLCATSQVGSTGMGRDPSTLWPPGVAWRGTSQAALSALPFQYDYSIVSLEYAKNAGNLMLVRRRVIGTKTNAFLENKEPGKYPVEFHGPLHDSVVFEIALPPRATRWLRGR